MRLVDYCARHRGSTVALAARTGIAKNTIGRIIAGKHSPTLATMRRISAATGGAVRPVAADFDPRDEPGDLRPTADPPPADTEE